MPDHPNPRERVRSALQARSSNRLLRFAYKLWQLRRNPSAIRAKPREALKFVLTSPEVSNLTYENANADEMAGVIASTLGADPGEIQRYLDELDGDRELEAWLTAKLRPNRLRPNTPRLGYRRISYAVVRAGRPRSIVECGTHDGLAASLMLRALERNAAEGSPGTLHTFDLTPDAGWLIPEALRGNLDLTIGDVMVELGPSLGRHGVDFFIEDFGCTFPAKGELVRQAQAAAEGELIVLTETDDNPVLAAITREAGGRINVFSEDPLDHWWHGHDWGLAALPAGGA